MAPVKISHVVSFSSQDPKYPVENLLNPDTQMGPWLSCPHDKTGQLKVELQLERAVPIGYIDVGNCGCAFLQIDVGRSSWSLDRPFVTLLPATMLMSLADSKQGKNRSGVRMFKDDDFLTAASGESWDRLRLTCSQPFARHQSFGLAFLRVCSSLDSLDDPIVDPSASMSSEPSQVLGESSFHETFPSSTCNSGTQSHSLCHCCALTHLPSKARKDPKMQKDQWKQFSVLRQVPIAVLELM
ncbi:protein XNDC1N isoform X3 [Saccopteryx bilineata]|uniref:protein XNDC1N isoform X3 n=1 Tax=Saccopteryx bilineata TaxID=59482 RepID=UPI00338DB977